MTLARHLPIIGWLPRYRREYLARDLAAGLTTAVMLVPQGMAYAMLAGLPPVMGLYASLVPLVAYALFGTSRQLAVGPVAMDSLLVAAGVGAIAAPGSGEYVGYAVLLAGMVGALQLVMGIARLGFITNFLSQPVVSGFTSAAALIIGMSQLGPLLGVDLPRSSYVHRTLESALLRLGDAHLPTLAIGVSSITLLYLLRRWRRKLPGALIVVGLGTLTAWWFGLDGDGVKIVGRVPAGLPQPRLPEFGLDKAAQLVPTALAIALVAFVEAISISKLYARREGYEIDANQELVGIGVANLGGSLFSGYPVTGGFSRTAVNAQAGAQTALAGVVTAMVVALTLLLFTPLFHFLPKAVLAAIIMTAVFGLIDLREVRRLWRVKRSDLALLLFTFVATLSLGIQQGILAGVLVSLLWFVARSTRPHVAVLGRLPGTRSFRNMKRYPEAVPEPGVLVVRMDAQLYFGNVSFLRETLRRLEAEQSEPLRAVVIDASGMNELDSSAEAALSEIANEYRAREVQLFFSRVKGPVRDVLRRSGLWDAIGSEHFFLDNLSALEAAVGRSKPEPAPESSSHGRRRDPST